MIYLIDDTKLESVNATFLLDKDYSNALRLIRTAGDFEKSQEALKLADCVLIHRTFANSTIYKERIAELTNDGELIPLVVFSAGDSEHAVYDEKKPYIIEGIKKYVFYSRLIPFLESFIKEHRVNLKILAYGKDYTKVKARSLALSVLRLVEGKEGSMTISELANIAACPDFKELISISNPELGIAYDDLLEELEDNPISFSIFRNNINQIVNSYYQYGKNIYIWK